MSNNVLAAIIVPIVVFLALTLWIVLVVHANRHPRNRVRAGTQRPRRQIAGGAFRATGGRQVTPNPEAEPSGPTSGYETPSDTARR